MTSVPGKGSRQAQYERRYASRRHWLDSLKIASGCIDCGCSGPPEVLTFDHVRGEKKFGIGTSWNQGRAVLEEEINKCEIVCANCHAKRTKSRGQDLPPFIAFPKIPRLFREIQVSEKIDGTNGIVWVDGEENVWAGSRNLWITTDNDNYGFAAWVLENEESFKKLGPNVWRGEWWGRGIQRQYGQTGRIFSLFNSSLEELPACCSVVPALYTGPFSQEAIKDAVGELQVKGSVAAPGYLKPEGIVVFHTASRKLYKVTIENDECSKSEKSK